MAFSATDAVFEGFRLARRNPLAILWWALLYFAMELANLAASSSAVSRATELTDLMARVENNPPTTPEGWAPILEAYGALISAVWWIMPVALLLGAVVSAAVSRGVLKPGEKAWGYVRVGADEVRVFVVTLVLSIAIGLIALVAFLAAAVLGGVAIATLDGVGALVMILAMLAAFALVIWLSVRWSLAVPITMARRRMAFFDSFSMTKGRFWPLLGMAILAGVLAIVIWLLAMTIAMPISVMSGMSAFSNADPAQIIANMNLMNPWAIAAAAINGLTYALIAGICYAPFSAAYLQLTNAPQPE